MPQQPLIQRTFAGGELAPVLHARADTSKYLSGLRTCHNFLVRREGGVTRRPGLRFVAKCKNDASNKKLLRYLGTTATTGVLIEAGSGYFRFFYQGAAVNVSGVPAYNGATAYVPGDLVSSAGVNYYCFAATTGNAPPNGAFWYALTGTIYEIPSPYGAANPMFKWYQSGNVIVITEPGQQPRELVFSSLTRWVLQLVSTAPSISPPTVAAGIAGAAGALTYRYVITAAALTTFEESNISNVATVAACALPTTAAPNTLSWTPPTGGAAEYYVYLDPYGNGTYGFIGTASTNAFNDTGFVPDFTVSPPIARVLFNSTNNYPDNAATYQQRRFYANTNLNPDSVEGSRVGFSANFGITSPLQDDDAVSFRLAGNGHHPVRAMVALKAGLVLLTDGGEWTATGAAGPLTPITPNSIAVDQETYVGVDPNVRPVVVGASILYLQARGSVLRELAFTQGALGGLIAAGRDLTIFASHLFEGFTVLAEDYQQVPDSIIWCVRSDGALLGLTYIPDEDVWGWHRHDTQQGAFQDICVVPEADRDVLYCLINRGGKRSIERLESRIISVYNSDAFFVDCGLTYVGAPATVISGFPNVLEGSAVAVLADGVVVSDGDPVTGTIIVTGGAITIPNAASTVIAGLQIHFAELETLDLDMHGAQIRDTKKRIDSVSLLVQTSGRSFKVGSADNAGAIAETDLTPYQVQGYEPSGALFSGMLEIGSVATFTPYGRLYLRVSDPVPFTLLGIVPNVGLGG